MTKEVIISIKGTQNYDGENDVIELVTAGTLTRQEGGYALTYEESELTGLEGTRTTFQVEDARVTLLRVGSVCSQMVFEEGQRHLSMYDTPYGSMEVGVNARRVRASLNDGGGQIEINYAIEIDHAVAGENLFRISVREKGPVLTQ